MLRSLDFINSIDLVTHINQLISLIYTFSEKESQFSAQKKNLPH